MFVVGRPVFLAVWCLLLLGAVSTVVVVAWVPPPPVVVQYSSPRDVTRRHDRFVFSLATTSSFESNDTKENTGLPELQGDFNWDEKFGGDSDWIVENVPGKIVLNEIELAQQITALSKLEETWKYAREVKEYEASKKIGFVEQAETLNGRLAMFFLTTGLLTEYWTGVSLPGQIEEMLRVGGFIGFE